MAESIIIEISADASKLTPVIDQLVKLGQVSAKDAEEFKKIAAASQTVTTETLKTTEAVKQSAAATTQASAVKEAALAKEIAKLKELQTLSGKAADPASAQRFAAAIKESENRVKGLNAELNKTPQPIKATETAFRSLRTQLLEARNEAARLAEEFGEFSPQAIAAANAAAKIDDKVKDLNKTIAALNPEQKLGAFLAIGTGISGAFTAAQGAMALFGTESEDVQKALLKVQGALALTQGLQSVLGLKDAFRDLRILLGITSAAQKALTTSTVAGAVATTGAAAATRAFTAALAANPITAALVVIAALVAAFVALDVGIKTTSESLEEYNEFLEKTRATEEALINALEAQRDVSPTIRNLQRQIDVTEELGGKQSDVIKLQLALNRAQDAYNDAIIRTAVHSGPTYNKYLQDNLDLANKREILQQKLNRALAEESRITGEVQKINPISEVLIANLTDEERLLVKINTELANAFGSGSQEEVNKFKNKITELSESLSEIPDKLDAPPPLKAPEIDFSDSKAKIRKAFADIFGDAFITDAGIEALDGFGDQAIEVLQNVFATIAAGAQQNVSELERLKDIQLNSFDEQLEGLEELNKNKIISDGKYEQDKKRLDKERENAEKELNKKIAESKRKAFIANRTAALAEIAIATARNAAELFAETVPPGILSALAVAFGALQAGIVLSQPVPQFKHGVIDLQGAGTQTSDSIPAMLSKRESVMTADETIKFKPTLLAIRKNLIPAEVLNRFVVEKNGGKVEAYIDTNLLNRANKKILPQQADMIGRSVARHLSKNKSPHYDSIRNEWVN